MQLDVTPEEVQALLNALALMNPLFRKLAEQLHQQQMPGPLQPNGPDRAVAEAPPTN